MQHIILRAPECIRVSLQVWHMGLCDTCRAKMSQMPQVNSHVARDRLFLEHVTSVLQWLKKKYPSLQLLMWDDMLRHMDPILLQGKCKI
jgi:hypothetical protein